MPEKDRRCVGENGLGIRAGVGRERSLVEALQNKMGDPLPDPSKILHPEVIHLLARAAKTPLEV